MIKNATRFLFSRKVLFLLLCLFLVTRLVHISADPPQDLSWSLGVFFDEGVYNHNARNQILFGQWKLDEWNDYYYSAISTWIKYQILKVIGVGRAQIRLISIVYSMLSLLFVYLAAKESYGSRTALMALLLFGGNYVSGMYSRLGMQDTQTLTIFIIAFYFWQKGLKALDNQHRWWGAYLFLGGVTVFLSYTYKNLFLYLLPVPFVALVVYIVSQFQQTHKRKQLFKAFGILSLGTGTAFFFWFLVFYRPNQHIIEQFGSFFTKHQMFPTSKISHFLTTFYTTPFFSYFSHTPVVLFGSLLTLLAIYFVLFSDRRSSIPPADLFLTTWFWAVFLFTGIIAYRPTRYFLAIIPVMCILTARGLSFLGDLKDVQLPKKLFWGVWPILWIWLTMIFGFGVMSWRQGSFQRAPALPFFPPNMKELAVSAGVAALFVLIIRYFWNRRPFDSLKISWQYALIIMLVLPGLSLYMNGRWYHKWFRHPQYTITEVAQDLMQYLGQDAYLGGMNAPGIAYDTPYKVLFSWDQFVNYRDNPIEKYHLTHLFLGDGSGSDERLYYFRQYPRHMSRTTPLQQYIIKNTVYTLFSLVEPKIADISLAKHTFAPGERLNVTVNVKNQEFRFPKKVLLNWFLSPEQFSGNINPSATGQEIVSWMSPKERRDFRVTGQLPEKTGQYRLLVSLGGIKEFSFQAEDVEHQIGQLVYDIEAMGNKAIHHSVTDVPEESFLVYGQYRYYPPGVYEALFRLKIQDTVPKNIIRIEAVTDYGETIFAQQDLQGSDFPEAQRYHIIILPFILKNGTARVEFRIYSYGITDVWADEIRTISREGVWYDKPLFIEEPIRVGGME